MLFWIVSSPANYYFHWLRAVTHQSNVNRYFSQGRTSVRHDATLRYCRDINQNGEDEGKYGEGVDFAKYTERKEGDYSERRTREGHCGITFRERHFGYTTDRFRKNLICTIFALASTNLRSAKTSVLVISTAFCTFLAQTLQTHSDDVVCFVMISWYSRPGNEKESVSLNYISFSVIG